MTESSTKHSKQLLIIEDDDAFATVLARRLARHGFNAQVANSTQEGLNLANSLVPNFVLLDMKVGDNNGIHILPELRALLPDARIILLTGYASIATAVDAIKAGADDYLAKPIDSASLLNALDSQSKSEQTSDSQHSITTRMSTARLEWEHIQQVLKSNDGNISVTARALGMHRRTLQRKLAKKPQAQ